MFDVYKRIAQKDIEQSIKSETSGSFEDALLAIGKLVGNGEWRNKCLPTFLLVLNLSSWVVDIFFSGIKNFLKHS